ncbi:unnamed protein product, partial [Timema podura]|nr:unnamed protein product [Timema podura]
MPETKPTKRKITVESPANKSKDSQRRPSVFERLGTKATSTSQPTTENTCRNWLQNGNCPYGKSCKYASTHTLISPSKRAAKKEGDVKQKQ